MSLVICCCSHMTTCLPCEGGMVCLLDAPIPQGVVKDERACGASHPLQQRIDQGIHTFLDLSTEHRNSATQV